MSLLGLTACSGGESEPATLDAVEGAGSVGPDGRPAAPRGAAGAASSHLASAPLPSLTPEATSSERALARRLGLASRFAIGLGNDVGEAESWDPARAAGYTLGPKIDIHYMYLNGLPGASGWTEWTDVEGGYVTAHAEAARARRIVPMFTLYQAASWGEGNLAAFDDAANMVRYFRGVRVLYERLAAFGDPAIVHVEPDFWGYTQARGGDDPAGVKVRVSSVVPECADLPNHVGGFGRCVVRLARAIAPNVVVGLSASTFGAFDGKGNPDAARVAAYLGRVGAAEADVLVVETLDRDAGCFERAVDSNCKRKGRFYWDESNVAHPNFHDHLAWAKMLRGALGRPLLWWQMPLGVPGSVAGAAHRYRDNRVRYLFDHPSEFADAGGIGAVFGTGAVNQTTVKTDGGQFTAALGRYLSAPVGLN